jgi:hypothetical protein
MSTPLFQFPKLTSNASLLNPYSSDITAKLFPSFITHHSEAVAKLHTSNSPLLTSHLAAGGRPTTPKGLVYLSLQNDHSVLILLVDGSLHSDPH